MKTIKKLIVTVIVLVIFILGCGLFYLNSIKGSVQTESEKVIFDVRNNASVKSILEDLKESNLIRDDKGAYFYLRLTDNTDFKAGTYELDKSMTFDEIVAFISDSRNAIEDTVRITFTEGEWLKHFASKIADATNLSYEELLNYWNDELVIKELIDEYPFLTDEILSSDIRYPLEGYLFPETYEFYRETDVKTVTEKLLNQTLKVYNQYEDEFRNSDLSIHEIFTLASIVQYEAADASDMYDIAGVFYNRLDIGMPLQSSVTVCYAMDIERDDDWRNCEYNPDYDSPYNTYIYYGLTPGPILNPGENAIKAVLEPSSHDYYYFMADVCGDGQVYYSKTYDEHLSYVNKFLKCY